MDKIKLSTLFITHDIDEAILLSDRIYLLTGTPGHISHEIVINEPRPRKQEFTLDDFLKQIRDVKKLGPLEHIIGMIPGLSSVTKKMKDFKIDEKEFSRIEAMICSMTVEERRNPSIIDASRKRRIANGSGTNVRDLNALLKQFESTRKMFKQFSELTKRGGLKKKMKLPF